MVEALGSVIRSMIGTSGGWRAARGRCGTEEERGLGAVGWWGLIVM